MRPALFPVHASINVLFHITFSIVIIDNTTIAALTVPSFFLQTSVRKHMKLLSLYINMYVMQ